MKLIKLQTQTEEWGIQVRDWNIPISAISAVSRPLLILSILFLAYSIGQTDVIIKQYNEKIAEANKKIIDCHNPNLNQDDIFQGFNLTNHTTN